MRNWVKFATPIFDGATTDEIAEYCEEAGIPDVVTLICMMVKQESVSIRKQLWVSFI